MSTHALNRSANASMESTANAAASSVTFGSNPKPSSRNACGRVICPLRSSACSSCIASARVFATLTSSLLGLALRAGASPSVPPRICSTPVEQPAATAATPSVPRALF
eukprot:scaffold45220_cov69-Phaeocystis_antarctica.AAC.2